MSWSPEQDGALSDVARWLKAGDRPIFRLFGYAGTGKTTLARHIAEGVDGDVLFAAFTGKAALVLREKGCPEASTIHSLIYRSRGSGEAGPSFVHQPAERRRQGEARRDRRMLDGRRGSRARSPELRQARFSSSETRPSSRP